MQLLEQYPIRRLNILLTIETKIELRDLWVGLYWNREISERFPVDVSWDLYLCVMTLLLHFRWIHAGKESSTRQVIRSLTIKKKNTSFKKLRRRHVVHPVSFILVLLLTIGGWLFILSLGWKTPLVLVALVIIATCVIVIISILIDQYYNKRRERF